MGTPNDTQTLMSIPLYLLNNYTFPHILLHWSVWLFPDSEHVLNTIEKLRVNMGKLQGICTLTYRSYSLNNPINMWYYEVYYLEPWWA